MPTFICAKCGRIENAATSIYWTLICGDGDLIYDPDLLPIGTCHYVRNVWPSNSLTAMPMSCPANGMANFPNKRLRKKINKELDQMN